MAWMTPNMSFSSCKKKIFACMRMLRKNPWNQIKKISFPLHCKMHNDSPIGISRNFSFSTPHQKARHSSTFIQIRALSKFAFLYSTSLKLSSMCVIWSISNFVENFSSKYSRKNNVNISPKPCLILLFFKKKKRERNTSFI